MAVVPGVEAFGGAASAKGLWSQRAAALWSSAAGGGSWGRALVLFPGVVTGSGVWGRKWLNRATESDRHPAGAHHRSVGLLRSTAVFSL